MRNSHDNISGNGVLDARTFYSQNLMTSSVSNDKVQYLTEQGGSP